MRSTWLALAAILAASTLARAEPEAREPVFSASIAYVAAPACPSAEDFKAIVIGRLGFDPFADDAPHHVLAVVTPGQRTWEGRLEWRDEAGHWAGDRTFPAHTTDCAELVRAMGFALAVQINLLATERSHATFRDELSEQNGATRAAPSASTETPRRPEGPPTSPAADSGAAPSAPAKARSAPWVFGLGVGGTLGVGLAPRATALGRVFGNAASGAWSFELGGELSTKTVTYRADGAGYSQELLLANAALCGSERLFSLCLLANAGILRVGGRSIDVPASPSGKALQTGLRFAVRERLGDRVFLAQRIDGLVNLSRVTVTLDQLPVWTAPTFASTVGLDVGAMF